MPRQAVGIAKTPRQKRVRAWDASSRSFSQPSRASAGQDWTEIQPRTLVPQHAGGRRELQLTRLRSVGEAKSRPTSARAARLLQGISSEGRSDAKHAQGRPSRAARLRCDYPSHESLSLFYIPAVTRVLLFCSRSANGKQTEANDDTDNEGAALPVATKENNWLGFCPSAVKLQNGDKRSSLKKRTDYGAAFAASGVTTYYCSQKNCAYMGHVSVDFVWKAVMKDERLGLKVRWGFLAKSHVFQAKVTGRQYQFQCPICIYSQGHAEGRTWKGVEIFMDHVSSHRGKALTTEVLGKLSIIDDRIADDKEEFDLNFFPTSLTRSATSMDASSSSSVSLSRAPTRNSIVDSIWNRKSSTATAVNVNNNEAPLTLSRTNTWRSDRADSVVGGAIDEEESWSEGLSHFKVDKEEDYLSPDF